MLTLITGAPGSGKTALALWMCLTEAKGRLLLVDGVKDLQIPYEKLPPLAEWTIEVEDPDSMTGKKLIFNFPPDSVILIDEAQRIYRPRANSATVPPYVAALETHRHGNHDIWLVTQHPGLLDANVRKLVNRHIHIKSNLLGGRKLYEWADEVGEVEYRGSRELASKRSYKPPKEVFGLYTSAVGHTAVKRRFPIYVYVGVGAVVLCGVFGWRAYRSVQSKIAPPAAASGSALSADGGGPGGHVGGPGGGSGTLSPAAWADQQRPRVAGLPHTAPVFDGVTTPKVAPFPSACIKSASRGCHCFTEQATVLEVEAGVCEQIVAGGFFDASLERPRHVEAVTTPGEARKPAAAVVARSEPIPTGAVVATDYVFTGSHVGFAAPPAAPAAAPAVSAAPAPLASGVRR